MQLCLKILHIYILVPCLNICVTWAVETGNLNEDFDNSLPMMKTIVKEHEPIVSPPMRDFIDYCNISGFYTIFRSGDITAEVVNETISRVKLNLGWKRLVVGCRIHNKILSIKIASATVAGMIEGLAVYTDALVNYEVSQQTRVQKVIVINPGKFEMQYHGDGFLGRTIGFAVNLIKPVVTKLVHEMVVETVEIMVHRTKQHLGLLGGQAD